MEATLDSAAILEESNRIPKEIPAWVRQAVAKMRAAGKPDHEILTTAFERNADKNPLGDVPEFYEVLGYQIPTVTTDDEARELALAGRPYWIGGEFSLDGDAAKHIDYAAQEAQAATQDAEYWETSPNRLKSVADFIQTPEIEWMVEGRLHRSGLCQIYGPSYAGRTLLVLDLVMSWCAGLEEWQGQRLNTGGEPQQAVYVAAEGGAALAVHVDAWLKHRGIPASRLSGLLFLDGGDGDHMFLELQKGRRDEPSVDHRDSWNRLVKEIVHAGIEPSLIVFDTQIDLAPGVDENSNADMVNVLRMVKRYADEMKFMAVVVHHTGHDESRARGASGMKGKCDVQARLEAVGSVGSGKARLHWEKVKGRAKPEDSLSYAIKGQALLPGLNSEGAICEPIGDTDVAIEKFKAMKPEDELRWKIYYHVGREGASVRSIAEVTGLSRNSKKLTDALEYLCYTKELICIKPKTKGAAKRYAANMVELDEEE
ncbi:AAA family ATPase [Zhihengliuella halotolerans]|uniref:AAA domain-containing protein n=1 Tax=Zhihengliuella halotolerans TaxID=370736 RepID=A0A4Q8ABA6_9MICC|nr:AAA family ATPase [Zhihengliuella halotolerans]RZU61437.1 AAA domain-containing protein [Zhihengliuella halotolerans]